MIVFTPQDWIAITVDPSNAFHFGWTSGEPTLVRGFNDVAEVVQAYPDLATFYDPQDEPVTVTTLADLALLVDIYNVEGPDEAVLLIKGRDY